MSLPREAATPDLGIARDLYNRIEPLAPPAALKDPPDGETGPIGEPALLIGHSHPVAFDAAHELLSVGGRVVEVDDRRLRLAVFGAVVPFVQG